MTLRESQAFVTRMMRDATFRELAGGPEFGALADAYGLDAADREQIRAIDAAEFGRFADYSRFQRVKRRTAEYGLFLNHLARYCDRETFFRDYHQAVTGGQGERIEELRRFDAFAFGYLLERGAPEYLVDLLRFCSAVCELGETPKARPDEATAKVASEEIGGTHLISLRQPFTVMTFRHDVLRLADESDPYGVDPLPFRTELLLQRDWNQHKRSLAFPLRDHPMLTRLTRGPARVLDLVAEIPELGSAAVLRLIRGHHANGLLHATPPPELLAGVVLKPEPVRSKGGCALPS